VVLVGQPNSGKTTLYNALTGSHYRTVNYPGSTVEYAVGRGPVGGRAARVMDTPGISSLTSQSPDEEVTARLLFGESRHGPPDAVVVVADVTQLCRHLYPAKQLIQSGHRVVVALTMADILERRKKMSLDTAVVAAQLGCPVVRVDGRTGAGVEELRRKIGERLQEFHLKPPTLPAPAQEADISSVYRDLERIQTEAIRVTGAGSDLQKRLSVCMPDALTDRLDRIFLHPVLGVIFFGAIMTVIFTSIFWLAQPMMDAIDRSVSILAGAVGAILPDIWLTQLITDGVIMGAGAVAVFIPQIVILFLGLGMLEDSGYLSRGAMIVDRPLAAVGLSGRGFVPILSGFACAIPAMMSTRAIPNARERLLTIFILPLMVCSARLPVYGLLLSFLTPPDRPWIGGLGLTGLYLFSVASGLIGAALFGRFLKLEKSNRPALLLELPAIRRPKLRVVVATTYQRTKSFIQKAGGTILAIAVILWVLTHFPPRPGMTEGEVLAGSVGASIGQWIEPVMRPLGLDWRVGVAMICAFAAREVFVGALALVLLVSSAPYGGGALEAPLLLAMRNAVLPDGSPLFTLSSCIGLIVFFVFALQCMSTVVVSRKETGGWRIPGIQLGAFTLVAYVAAVFSVQILRWLGLP